MKKIFLLLSIVSVFGLTGCNNDDDVVIVEQRPEVFEVGNVNFIESGDLQAIIPLEPTILPNETILVYRLSGTNTFGNDIWEPIPTTYNLPQGQLDYNFDFSQDDVVLYLDTTFDPMLRQDFSLNQIFRIVILPGYVADNLNNNDFDTVMSALNEANDSPVQIKTIK